MTFSSVLFKKYNVPGPRYTSYPTVPYWDHNPSQEEWIKSISSELDFHSSSDVGAALYIHIPFCESLCTYCGCNTRITRNHKIAEGYIQSVLKEWELYRKLLGREIKISEIHLGGGTPTFLSPDELKHLLSGILDTAQITSDREFSLEADPRVTKASHLEVLHQLGFRRLSLGIQDFDSKVQEIVHRIQSEEQVRVLTEKAREIGFNSINFDLIYGLPLQTLESIEKTMGAICRLRPDRIAFYGYAHVPWIKPSQRRFTEADLPAGDDKRALYELGRNILEEVGYFELGLDHFALKSDSLWEAAQKKALHRNFMGYISRRVSPLIGLGVSAIGDSWNIFAQNEKMVEIYQSRLEKDELPILRGHILTEEDRILRKHILNLMTEMETDWGSDLGNLSYLNSIPERLSEMEKDGLVELTTKSCKILPAGRPFMRNVCMAFDARLSHKAPSTQLFSRTI